MPWNLKKGYELGKKVVGLVDDLIDGVAGYFKAGKTLEAAQGALSKAQDKLAAARKKATTTRQRGGETCEVNHSFLPGTPVLLDGGTSKPIEEVELGDKLVVTDPETGETTVREVAGTIVTEDDKHFVDLTVEGESGEPETLVSTTTHPFWVESENRWIEAGDLKPGMELRTADGDLAPVRAVHRFDERQRTHDLTLTEIHTYYVLAGATPVLVHNCNTTVGRWMSEDEHQAMSDTGKVQAGSGGTSTYVAHPANSDAYRKQAAPGSIYAEFDVPCSCLKPAGEPGWAQIPGPQHPIYAKLNAKRGLPPPEMPSFENLRIVDRK
ncbi:HINT domain-containing protein [Streptomyces somaliensis]|nr:HINT domain-containing protein [Streptomyces somaliensis]MCP9973755.1 HINT domain-containing protein [Streptomyces somaliensis]